MYILLFNLTALIIKINVKINYIQFYKKIFFLIFVIIKAVKLKRRMYFNQASLVTTNDT